MTEDQEDSFNASRAEDFEALGHPTRIRILRALSDKALGFSELKRETGIGSSGLLAFHLGKLTGLVRPNRGARMRSPTKGGRGSGWSKRAAARTLNEWSHALRSICRARKRS